MKVLVVNIGSTGVKYTFFDGIENREEREFKYNQDDKNWLKGKDFQEVIFRVVHGGELYGLKKINQRILKKIEEYQSFAPIHNFYALKKIEMFQKIFSKKRFWVYFDTSFHQTIPIQNYSLALPKKISQKYKLRKYGFHGIALESIIKQLKNKKGKIIVAHLGGGSSITAIKNGKSFANTMGITPISGLMMVSRVGDIDVELWRILREKGLKDEEISELLNFQSGFLGLTGTKDIKKIFEEWKKNKGDWKNKYFLAVEIYLNQIVEKIAGYVALMGGVDKIVFSGGIGYRNEYLAGEIVKRLKKVFGKIEYQKIKVDEAEILYEHLVEELKG